jgi:hypothetical protein
MKTDDSPIAHAEKAGRPLDMRLLLFISIGPEFEWMSMCVYQKIYDRLSRGDDRLSRATQKKVPFFTT